MIASISILSDNKKVDCLFNNDQSKKIVINLKETFKLENNSFDIEVVFSQSILAFRRHDYTWVKFDKDVVVNEFCPKIIELSSGLFIQPNNLLGVWEFKKNTPNVLLWRFNPENSKPLTTYKGVSNQKRIISANSKITFYEDLALLITNSPIEFSRSKTPFTAISVFTDHCDFDTVENLKLQRKLFKNNGLKITKGFFLNHFSKREDNASFQNDKEELLKWKEDGHELCYHSLSQSIKSDEESFEDFYSFQPPFENSTTWIDHGYQPYNFSLFQNNFISENDFQKTLSQKNITTLWNYIDSGTTTVGVINQLDTQQFTLSSFLRGNADLSFLKKMQLMIKNIIFHYYGDEQLILKYKSTATHFKKFISQKKISYFFSFIKDLFLLSNKIGKVFLYWNRAKYTPYKLAKYSPILYKHKILEKEFYVFQTVEMLDFIKSLSQKNIDKLIEDKGIFVAHTYFSVPMDYHRGKVFSSEKIINSEVAKNFKNLGDRIKNNQIWNPTLQELIAYWSGFEKIVLDVDHQGTVFVKNKTELLFRTIV